MFRRLINWFRGEPAPEPGTTKEFRRRANAHAAIQPRPDEPEQAQPMGEPLDSHIENSGPDKDVLIRNKYIREDTGTHEELKIVDDSTVDFGEEDGIDPYNSGAFDRSKNWDKRFRN